MTKVRKKRIEKKDKQEAKGRHIHLPNSNSTPKKDTHEYKNGRWHLAKSVEGGGGGKTRKEQNELNQAMQTSQSVWLTTRWTLTEQCLKGVAVRVAQRRYDVRRRKHDEREQRKYGKRFVHPRHDALLVAAKTGRLGKQVGEREQHKQRQIREQKYVVPEPYCEETKNKNHIMLSCCGVLWWRGRAHIPCISELFNHFT